MNKHVIIADDNAALVGRLQPMLERRDYMVSLASTVGALIDEIIGIRPGLLVLGARFDATPTEVVTTVLCHAIQTGSVPVLFSQDDETKDADPCWQEIKRAHDLADQIERISGRGLSADRKYPVRYGDIIVNPENYEVRIRGQSLSLRILAIEILYQLALHPAEVMSRRSLMDAVWGKGSSVNPQIINVYIKTLRAACRRAKSDVRIYSVRAVGYQLKQSSGPKGSQGHEETITSRLRAEQGTLI